MQARVVLVVASILGVGACKGKEAPPADEPAGDAAVMAKTPPMDAAGPPPIDSPPDGPVNPWGDPGTCKLEAKGAKTLHQPDGQANTVISAWFTEVDRPKDQVPDTFVINCSGTKLQLTVASSPHGATFGPKQYTLDKTHSELQMQGVVDGITLVEITGTLDVTTFDKHRFVANVKATAKLGDQGKAVTITGTVNYPCPGFAGCVPPK